MSGLGERLKKEREIRGVTLDEIAQATRIHKKFLKALEENDFDALPAPVFVTGFLRSYAQHLGMDADSLVAEYEAIKKPPKEYQPLAPEERKLPFISKEDINRHFPLIAAGGGILLLLVLLAVFIARSGGTDEKVTAQKTEEEDLLAQPVEPAAPVPAPVETLPAEPEKPASAPEAAVAKKPEQPANHAAAPEKTAAAKPVEKPKPEAVAKPAEKPKNGNGNGTAEATATASYKYSLGLSATDQDVWVYVVIDDGDVRDMYVRAGQTVFLRGNASFVLTTGNSFYLKLKVNGAAVDIPSAGANKVIRNWSVPLPG